MKTLVNIARQRFSIITNIVGHVQARVFVTALYYTLVVPFAGLARIFTGPLVNRNDPPSWLDRAPTPTDLDSAYDQG